MFKTLYKPTINGYRLRHEIGIFLRISQCGIVHREIGITKNEKGWRFKNRRAYGNGWPTFRDWRRIKMIKIRFLTCSRDII